LIHLALHHLTADGRTNFVLPQIERARVCGVSRDRFCNFVGIDTECRELLPCQIEPQLRPLKRRARIEILLRPITAIAQLGF
jgi:hypothetical protein